MILRLPGRRRPRRDGPCRMCREHVRADDAVGVAPLRFCSEDCERRFCGRELIAVPFLDG